MQMARKTSLKLLGLCGVLGAALPLASGQSGWEPRGSQGAVDERLVETRATVDRGHSRKAEIDAELAAIGPKRSTLQEQVSRHGRALYRVSRGGMLPLAGGLEAMLGHASRVERLTRVVQGELSALQGLDHKSVALRREAMEIESRLGSAEREVRALEQARVGLAQQEMAQQLFDSAFVAARAREPSDDRVSYGLSVIGGSSSTEKFADQRGNLALPVSGPSNIQDANRAESDGPGLEFASSPGAAVRAAAAGRVAFADRYGSYGQIVILDHGDRFYTVYGGLARIDVQAGDDLSKSARVGSASADPVYFEVRRCTRTQDARVWLGL